MKHPHPGRFPWRTVLAALLAAGLAAGAEGVDPRAWTELDIVPMPKEIRLIDQDLVLAPDAVTLVLGAQACRQSEIGAEWINRRLADVAGATPLPVARAMPAAGTAIIIGTPADHPLLAEAVAAGLVNVGPNNPGERGYAIRRSADGRRIYLAGADPIGALYACVTFGELLEARDGRAVWRAAEVRDWPDAIWVALGCLYAGNAEMPELLKRFKDLQFDAQPTTMRAAAYLEAARGQYDWLLRRKVTMMMYPLRPDGQAGTPTKGLEIVRQGIAYGDERGIEAFTYALPPYAGLASRYPDLAKSRVCPRTLGPHAEQSRQWLRCWSLDDVCRTTARETAEYIRAAGLRHIAFHDTDTGYFDNPAQWEERCDVCRQRWGDDYTAATLHKHRIYYDEIKKLNPAARLHFTFYPYGIAILDPEAGRAAMRARYGPTPAADELAERYRARYTEFWRRLHAAFPAEDVTFCIREAPEDAVRAFRALTPGRGMFTWFALMSHAWRPFFSEAATWTGTFVGNPRDVFYPRYLDEFVPLEALAVREYSWNRRTPGAQPWARDALPENEQWKHAEPNGPIYDLILPRLARNVFGRAAGPAVAAAVSQNVDRQQIYDRQHAQFAWLKDVAKLEWQAGNAGRGAAALDAADGLGMDTFARTRFTVLREQFRLAAWMARARVANARARELARRQDLPGAEAAIAAGLAAARAGRADRERLLAERPADPVLRGKDHNRYAGNWREYTADRADFTPIEETLARTRAELKS